MTHCNTRTERGGGSSQATHFPLEPLLEELLDEEAAPSSPATPATPAKGKAGQGKSPLRRHVSAGPGTLLGRPPTQRERERQLTKTEMTRRKSVLAGGGGGMAGGKLAEAAAAEQERAEGGQSDAKPRGATPSSRKAKQKEARRETVAGQVG